jgi:hypothetical protein
MRAHRIDRMEIELGVADVALAERLSARVSALRSERIGPLLDRVFEELSPPDRLNRISTLDLDLGTLSSESFDDELLERLERALRRALETELEHSSGVRSTEASIELVEAFARTGNVPWWADSDAGMVERHLEILIADAPAELTRVLRTLDGDEAALARLARHGAGGLERLVERVWPALARPLFARLAALAVGGSGTREIALHALAGEVDHDDRALDGPRRPTPVESIGTDADLDVLRDRHDPSAVRVRHATLAALLHARPTSVEEALDAVVAALAARSPDRRVRSSTLIEASAGADRGAGASVRDRRAWDGSVRDEPIEHASATPDEAHALEGGAARPPELRESATAPTAISPRATPSERSASETRRAAELRSARRRALERLEELHVGNAGLVILWPFLARFFARTELLDDAGRFRSDERAMHAVVLLEQLARGVIAPDEHRLPLAKILTGREVDSEVDTDDVTEAEIAEADRLLRAVIDRAPILGEMPVPVFRGMFLERAGVLEVEAGGWLLRVERRTHDALLDRFPWSWSWVRLPFMGHPLRVEW